MNRNDHTKQPELEIKLPQEREQELLAWANAEEKAPDPVKEETAEIQETPRLEHPKITPEEELRGELQQLLRQFAAEEKAAEPVEAEVEPAEAPAEEKEPKAPEGAEEAPEEAPAEEERPAEEEAPVAEGKKEAPLAAVSYESVAQAVEEAQKEPGESETREAIDDDTLLAELYALIGDPVKGNKPTPPVSKLPEKEGPPVEIPEPKLGEPKPMPRLSQEEIEAIPEEEEEILLEEDSTGVPGWLKGAFLLLVSLLLSSMTFYAVASDVLGTVF